MELRSADPLSEDNIYGLAEPDGPDEEVGPSNLHQRSFEGHIDSSPTARS